MKMKIRMYLVPIILQMIYFLFTNLYKYVSSNNHAIGLILSHSPLFALYVAFIAPLYLIGVYIYYKDWRNRGVLKPHIYMAISICISEFIHYLAWSGFNMEKFMNPDGMTQGLTEGAVKNGLYLIGISLIISVVVKLFNVTREHIVQRRSS